MKEEGWQLFVFVALYKLSRFMHTASVNLYSNTVMYIVFVPVSADLHTWICGRILGMAQSSSPGLHSEPTEGLTSTFLGFG